LASSGGEHGDSGFNKTADFIQRIVNFTILVGALFFLLRKPVKKVFADRTQEIQESLADLERQKEAAEKKYAEYKGKLALLEQETGEIIASYIAEGEAAKAQIVDEAKKMAEKMQEQAKVTIRQEFEKAKAQIQGEIVNEAVVAAEKLIKTKINDEDQDRLVNEYVAKVVVAQ
jgi:F-type H+-transporting ATPase subunit b